MSGGGRHGFDAPFAPQGEVHLTLCPLIFSRPFILHDRRQDAPLELELELTSCKVATTAGTPPPKYA